jgi:hypothetical protein
VVENRWYAPRSDEQGHPISHCQGVWMVHLQTLAIQQRNRERSERRPVLESADRAVKGISVHCVSPRSRDILLLDGTRDGRTRQRRSSGSATPVRWSANIYNVPFSIFGFFFSFYLYIFGLLEAEIFSRFFI